MNKLEAYEDVHRGKLAGLSWHLAIVYCQLLRLCYLAYEDVHLFILYFVTSLL
jgi:hypothetical protein